MTDHKRSEDSLLALLSAPLPEHDDTAFRQALLSKTSRILFWRKTTRAFTWLFAVVALIAAVPRESLLALINSVRASLAGAEHLNTQMLGDTFHQWWENPAWINDIQTQHIAIASVMAIVVAYLLMALLIED